MWVLRSADEESSRRVAAELALPGPVARMLVARGYANPDSARRFLHARESLDAFRRPVDAPSLVKAVARIRSAVASGECIGIYGDYDCDGVTSAAILYRYLCRGLGANVVARLPDRFRDGYGVHPGAVEQLAHSGCSLILTCDNGISGHAAAKRARELGVDLIITDHHKVPDQIPDAFAIVHPQLEFSDFSDLCGAGVAFLLVIALEGGLSARLESFLDLVAIGTVADVMPLDGPNRPLVWAGISRMRRGQVHPGTRALAEVAGLALETLTTRDLGFTFGPRLNAAGRLETPDCGFQLLITNDRNEARRLASQLDSTNTERRELDRALQAKVITQLEEQWDLQRRPFVVLAEPDFHHGLVGIVAGKVCERINAPVLLLAPSEDGTWRGSGRSPAGFNLYDSLLACSKHLLAFGGHRQAAGCRVQSDRVAALCDALNQYVAEVGWSPSKSCIWLDAELPFGQATAALLEATSLLEPFGQGNPEPVFGLLEATVLGTSIRKDRHLFMQLDDGESVEEVIAWGQAAAAPKLGARISLSYRLQWNSFRGQRQLQRLAGAFGASAPKGAQAASSSVRECAAPEIVDARIERWRADEFAATGQVYGHRDPGGANCWLPPLAAWPAQLGTVICQDVPANAEIWQCLLERATTVVLAWEELDGSALDPDALVAVYQHLAGRRGLELFTAIAGSPVPLADAQAAVKILREAGLMVQMEGEWRLLSPPEGPIALTKLSSYLEYLHCRQFRQELFSAEIGKALGLGGFSIPSALGESPCEPVTA